MIKIENFLRQSAYRDFWGFKITNIKDAQDIERVINTLINEFPKLYRTDVQVLRGSDRVLIQYARKIGD